jgi:DNA-binding IclR family transcriptional regulator
MTTAISRIHARLAHSPACVPDLAIELGMGLTTVYESLKRLEKKRKVRRIGFGYRISTRCRTRPYLWSAV